MKYQIDPNTFSTPMADLETLASSFVRTTMMEISKEPIDELEKATRIGARLRTEIDRLPSEEDRAMFMMLVAAVGIITATNAGDHIAQDLGHPHYAAMVTAQVFDENQKGWAL